jgi:diguanylate cyclase (GGDEF)-like protein/PAS domain S-box-containing protein
VQYVHPDDKNFVVDAIQTTVVLKSDFNITYRLVLDDGSIRFIKEDGKPFVNDSGDTVIIGTARDITLDHLRTELLKMGDSVFSNSQDGIIVTDDQLKIMRVNDAFRKITGYSEEETIGKTPAQLLRSGRHDAHFYDRLWYDIKNHGEWSGRIWDINAKGESFLSEQFISSIFDEQTQAQSYVSIIRDITEAHRNEELLRKRAYFDNLTKLPNRSLFQDRLSEKLAKVRRGESRFALCFADLDGFKQINDTHGHEAGDIVLAETASRMAMSVRESDTVARLAGDEFTIILDEVNDRETALQVVSKIIDKINEPVSFKDQSLYVGASFGIIIVNKKSQDTIEELLSYADKAMYEAKQAGKNRAIVYHHPKL